MKTQKDKQKTKKSPPKNKQYKEPTKTREKLYPLLLGKSIKGRFTQLATQLTNNLKKTKKTTNGDVNMQLQQLLLPQEYQPNIICIQETHTQHLHQGQRHLQKIPKS